MLQTLARAGLHGGAGSALSVNLSMHLVPSSLRWHVQYGPRNSP